MWITVRYMKTCGPLLRKSNNFVKKYINSRLQSNLRSFMSKYDNYGFWLPSDVWQKSINMDFQDELEVFFFFYKSLLANFVVVTGFLTHSSEIGGRGARLANCSQSPILLRRFSNLMWEGGKWRSEGRDWRDSVFLPLPFPLLMPVRQVW